MGIHRNGARSGRSRRAGAAVVVGLVAVVALLGITAGFLALAMRSGSERQANVDTMRATYMARSAVAHALLNFHADDFGAVGDAEDPVALEEGEYWASVADNGDDTWTVAATGRTGRIERSVEAIVATASSGVYGNGVFAGNSSEDPLYELPLGGVEDQADEILGGVYSGGDVVVTGDATVSGDVGAAGTVTGTSGAGGVQQPIPDLAGMAYHETAEFDVAELFSAASWEYDDSGGSAWQLPESSPAHVFRKNPTDRASESLSTEKDDYFLEDPYEVVQGGTNPEGKDAYKLSLSGLGGDSGPNANGKVFYVDGNLWLHNRHTYSFRFKSSGTNGVQVTFVVRGNIYFSDNLFYTNQVNDGVAFIAMKDEDVEDSGNIYFGDPEFGTLETMNAFMYAENDFHDVNLDASGSAVVNVRGNMTAGNHVEIERDYEGHHTKLRVEFDDRLLTGDLELPGLPSDGGLGNASYEVVAWRRMAGESPAAAGPGQGDQGSGGTGTSKGP